MLAILKRCNHGIAAVERVAVAILLTLIPILILSNVVGRAMGRPIFWVEEFAVYLMVWLALIGMSLTVHYRANVAVTLLLGSLPEQSHKVVVVLIDAIVLVFAGALLYLCYIWFDPLTLIRVDFDFRAFRSETFNYIYQERTSTVPMPKFWLWLAVPLSALLMLIHSLFNLLESARSDAASLRQGGAGTATE